MHRENNRNVIALCDFFNRIGDTLHPVTEIFAPVAGHADDPLASETRLEVGQA